MGLTRKTPVDQSGVRLPYELKDLAAEVWRDADLYAAWLDKHLPGEHRLTAEQVSALRPVGWVGRFNGAVNAWARANDVLRHTASWPDFIDGDRVKALGGFPFVPALERFAAYHGTDLPVQRPTD